MRIPVEKSRPSSRRRGSRSSPPASANNGARDNRRPKLRIFLVEDHPATAHALKTFLCLRRCKVEMATDLDSAVALAPKIEFDVLVCDLNLPDGSGWDLPARLGHRARSRAIAYSALDGPDDLLCSQRAGFAEHVVKGCDPDELIAAIKRVSEGKGLFAASGKRSQGSRRTARRRGS
jgi:DNA-binding NarL/FixJ family response regulator